MADESFRRRHLPHWDVPGAAYFVTTCLRDSVPARGRLDLLRYRDELAARRKPDDLTEDAWHVLNWKRQFARLDRWLDEGEAGRLLERPDLAQIVVRSFAHFAGERYALWAFVVMPSHIHWVFEPLAAWADTLPQGGGTPRERVVYGLNRFTARECNRALGRAGAFWQGESYDHRVRSTDELERIIRYVEGNPVKAGLAAAADDWRFSSARAKRDLGVGWGRPIPRGIGRERVPPVGENRSGSESWPTEEKYHRRRCRYKRYDPCP